MSDETIRNDSTISRRALFGAAGAAAVATAGVAAPRPARAEPLDPQPPGARAAAAFEKRLQAAAYEARLPYPRQRDNGDDQRYPDRIASYTKGLPHDALGVVQPAAYEALRRALASGRPEDFDAIPLGGARKLVHPQGGFEHELFGPDSHHLASPPAPAFASAEHAADTVEVYWQALLRDVPFADWASDPTVAAACAELGRLSGFSGPRVAGAVTPDVIFRLPLPGALVGPYVSQFLVRDVPYGALTLPATVTTLAPGVDYLTTVADWLAVQNGANPPPAPPAGARLSATGRDLAQYVHVDVVYQAYWNALVLLLALKAPLDAANPYRASANQQGNADFGPPHVASLLGAVANRATKAVWYQKWNVHRRLRPEAMGGRVHFRLTSAAAYDIHGDLLGSDAVARTFARQGTYLLPQAWPEGSPVHPSYPGGHAVIAGACVTVLKAFFDETFVLPAPVVPTRDGLGRVPWTGAPLTLGGELDKLAMNVGMGRDFGGIHYRSDALASLRLGEEVAIRMMREDRLTYHEPFTGFSLTRFDGTTITI